MAEPRDLYKKYLAETLSDIVDGETPISGSTPDMRGNFRVTPRIGPISTESRETNIGYMRDLAKRSNYEGRRKEGLSDYNYDAVPKIKNTAYGKALGLNSSIQNDVSVGPFRSDMIAGSFSVGGVEFDVRNLQTNDATVNEALLTLVTELLLFISDIKGNEKFRSVMDSYVSDVDTLPQSVVKKNISLPVIDSNWAYPGPVYKDRNLPHNYRIKETDQRYCGKCFNYVGNSSVGKCHRYNNVVSPYYVCSSYDERNTSFYAGDYKGRFMATDEQGKNVFYHRGDVVKFKSKTYIATRNTSATVGSPIHSNSGWRLIDEEILDGGEF
jgi:hypothetical protein